MRGRAMSQTLVYTRDGREAKLTVEGDWSGDPALVTEFREALDRDEVLLGDLAVALTDKETPVHNATAVALSVHCDPVTPDPSDAD